MVIYNLADTYFVGMLNNPVENAAVTLAAPVLLAFNAVNNLFGVGTSSMMSRAMGRRDYDTVYRSSAFGFYCALFSGILFSLLCVLFRNPLLVLLGADEVTIHATEGYMRWTVFCGAAPAILNVVMAYMVRSEGSALNASIGTMSGCVLNMILENGWNRMDSQKLYEMLEFANAAASIITTKKGALKVMPSKDDILNLIQERK